VAVVTGDDVLAWMQAQRRTADGQQRTVRSLDGQLISANAYLGADACCPRCARAPTWSSPAAWPTRRCSWRR
jgi:hypothetical protein